MMEKEKIMKETIIILMVVAVTVTRAIIDEEDAEDAEVLNYSHSRNPRCAPARTHGQIQAPREPPN
jgi:hypothetical protein